MLNLLLVLAEDAMPVAALLPSSQSASCRPPTRITYAPYVSELQLPAITALVEVDLSEPYSIYTYRYFLHNWPNLCFLAMASDEPPQEPLSTSPPPSPPATKPITSVSSTEAAPSRVVGCIVCKLAPHKSSSHRGYIAMLVVDKQYRHRGIGSMLAKMAVAAMQAGDADECVLETEETNTGALGMYERLGFVRDKRLSRYYLNGVDAFRLKLRLK
ncbi:N-alpha-acetyltransferase 30 [Geranomyces michiganensis]|nr:N-alpha-acetyltransferase 30 [Geranomyces michiganensis]